MKPCLRCERKLPLESFSRHRSRADGRQPYCKACTAAISKASRDRQAARTNIPTPAAKRCARCGKLKPAHAFYGDARMRDGLYGHCRPCHNMLAAEWSARHPETRTEITRRTYLKHQARHQTRGRAYYWANRDRIVERKAVWAANNQRTRAFAQTRRKARKTGAAGSASDAQLLSRWAYYGGRCWMCGRAATAMDHVKPLICGGTQWPANQRPACGSCNSSKGGMWPLDELPARLAVLWSRRAQPGPVSGGAGVARRGVPGSGALPVRQARQAGVGVEVGG